MVDTKRKPVCPKLTSLEKLGRRGVLDMVGGNKAWLTAKLPA